MPKISYDPTLLTEWILSNGGVDGLRLEKKDKHIAFLNDAGEVATIRSNGGVSFTVIWKPEAYKPLLTKIAEYEKSFPGTRNDVRCTFKAQDLGGTLVEMNVLRMTSSKPAVVYGFPKLSEWLTLITDTSGLSVSSEEDGYATFNRGGTPVAEVINETVVITDSEASPAIVDLVTRFEETFTVTVHVDYRFETN